MAIVLLFIFSGLLDVFYIGGSIYLYSIGWSGWWIVLGFFISACSFPTKFIAALNKKEPK